LLPRDFESRAFADFATPAVLLSVKI
jgi:hypothetical protein